MHNLNKEYVKYPHPKSVSFKPLLQVETFRNGPAKEVSAGVVLFNMVGFMKLFELPLRDRFHEVILHDENLVFITTAIVATVAEIRRKRFYFSQRKFKKFHENRP